MFGRPEHVSAVLDVDGPLEIDAEQGATMLWTTDTASVTVRVDYVTRPPRRGALVTSPSGSVAWDPTTGTVTVVTADGDGTTTTTPEDLDRDTVMARQARAALTLAPTAPLGSESAPGAPATLAEGVRAVEVCDEPGVPSREGPPNDERHFPDPRRPGFSPSSPRVAVPAACRARTPGRCAACPWWCTPSGPRP